MDWNAVGLLAREAFQGAVNAWLANASISGGVVNGGSLMLMPGCLASGVSIERVVLSKLTASRVAADIAQPLARELASAWNVWAGGFTLSAFAYPIFVNFPGSMAPPTPSIPLPLGQATSMGETALMSPVLAGKLTQPLRLRPKDPLAGTPDQAMNVLAAWVQASFQQWKAVTRLVHVMGTGPVPTFAPPRVIAGPVVGGTAFSQGSPFEGPTFGN